MVSMEHHRAVCCVVLLLSVLVNRSLAAKDASDIVGTWLVEEKTGKIQIFKCGDKYCGKTIWIKPSKEHPNPQEMRDIHNPNPQKRTQKILGQTMLWGLTYDNEDRRWEEGSIYDSRKGKVYSCQATLRAGGKELLLRGFIGISLIGQTTVWTRLN
jgi:uncharacterized protein (DUF2147 family)